MTSFQAAAAVSPGIPVVAVGLQVPTQEQPAAEPGTFGITPQHKGLSLM